jgi:hypothetical protein
MRFPLLTLIFIAAAGCTAMHDQQTAKLMDPYVGQPVSEVAARFGAPTGNYDMGVGGMMAFEWRHFGSGQSGGADCVVMVAALPNFGNVLSTPPTDLTHWIVQTWHASGAGCL